MTWRAAGYVPLFEIHCPYCLSDEGIFDRRKESKMPEPRVCSECERTYIIPVTVSRGAS